MAGLTTGYPLSCHKATPSSLSSSDSSKLFGLRIPTRSHNHSFLSRSSLSSSAHAPITARFGGGRPRYTGGGGGGGDSRRFRKNEPIEEDEALDLSLIRSDSVRLIDAQQNMVGVVTKAEAIQMAETAELDLVILSPDADPPVLRIMDYNKYKYELQKKKRDQQKKSAASRMDMKELKMGYNIDQHDYSVRLRSAQKFLKAGDKVKVIVNLKGRENEFRNFAIELLRRFQTDVGELATEEAKNLRERNIYIIMVPNKAILQAKAQEPPPKRKDKSLDVEVEVKVDEEVSASV